MDPLENVIGFDWDQGNERKNVKHGVTAAEAEQVFLNEPLVVADDVKHSNMEQRFHALGQTNERRLLHVTFTIRENRIRVVSARDMNKKERAVYEQEP